MQVDTYQLRYQRSESLLVRLKRMRWEPGGMSCISALGGDVLGLPADGIGGSLVGACSMSGIEDLIPTTT